MGRGSITERSGPAGGWGVKPTPFGLGGKRVSELFAFPESGSRPSVGLDLIVSKSGRVILGVIILFAV